MCAIKPDFVGNDALEIRWFWFFSLPWTPSTCSWRTGWVKRGTVWCSGECSWRGPPSRSSGWTCSGRCRTRSPSPSCATFFLEKPPLFCRKSSKSVAPCFIILKLVSFAWPLARTSPESPESPKSLVLVPQSLVLQQKRINTSSENLCVNRFQQPRSQWQDLFFSVFWWNRILFNLR